MARKEQPCRLSQTFYRVKKTAGLGYLKLFPTHSLLDCLCLSFWNNHPSIKSLKAQSNSALGLTHVAWVSPGRSQICRKSHLHCRWRCWADAGSCAGPGMMTWSTRNCSCTGQLWPAWGLGEGRGRWEEQGGGKAESRWTHAGQLERGVDCGSGC